MLILEAIIDGVLDIKDHMGRTLLQLLGIILGAGSIVATFSLSVAGKEQAMKFYRVSGGIERIWIGNKDTGKITLDAKALASRGLTYRDAAELRAHAKEIDLVAPISQDQMVIRYGAIEKKRDVMGVTPEYSPITFFKVEHGRFVTDTDLQTAARVVVLGTTRATEFFGSDNPIGKTISINGAGYLVVGVMEEKWFSRGEDGRNALRWMNRQMYIPLTTFMTRKGEPLEQGRISFMYARMKDIARHEEAVADIESILQRQHGVRDFQVFSRVANLARNESEGKMYDVTFMVCGIISLLVGGIVIMNIQLASFNERVREIGTRKAVGATPAQIFVQMLTESVLVSVLGGFLGIFAGKFFTQGISMLTRNAATITPGVVMNALIFAVGTGLIFGMYPAIRASRLNPIEALRTE
ncbi:MAG TPA: ABC transporter permease [Thermoanaerobaculia bacterium]|jgi:putative ABC transport system permease protein|nr:ABC transporter permease [Thermoanaerobaculia bacterium]